MLARCMGMCSLSREDLPKMGICSIVPDLPGMGILQHKAGSDRKDRGLWLGLVEDESITLR